MHSGHIQNILILMRRKLKLFGDRDLPLQKEEIAIGIFINDEVSSMSNTIGRRSTKGAIFKTCGCFPARFVYEKVIRWSKTFFQNQLFG